MIPEAIAFSIITGVDPKVGLYASFSIAVITAIVGGRPAMISTATAATAVLMVTLVKDHGLQYLLATTVLAGLLQISAGFLKLGYVMRFVSRSVMTGFVNALAILIFMAQLPELMRTRLTDGEVQFRKAYLAALIERVEAGDDDIPIFGQKTVLEQQVANGSGAGPSVRSFVGRWRPVGDASK